MKRFDLLLMGIVVVAVAAGMPDAQYWFQSGAISPYNASFNNGASVYMQTIYPQSDVNGSFGFWVGETLSNGAFAQVGYEVPNSTAVYPENCDTTGCTGSVTLSAGIPTWFWEYFPTGGPNSGFYGGIGQNNSAGPDGSFNRFSFKSFGDVWYFYMNGEVLGSVNLGTSNSGAFSPTAFAEYADTYDNSAYMKPVIFSNLSIYKNGVLQPVPYAQTYIGYGKSSETALYNPYGVKELGNRINYFDVGSGLPLYNGTLLWKEGFHLSINSQFNASGSGEYISASSVGISAPAIVYISNGKRAYFSGWKGYGIGSYTGSDRNATVYMGSNITEYAAWITQYYVNVSTQYGASYGSGWYDNGSIAKFYVPNSIATIGYGARAHFGGWSDGSLSNSSSVIVSRSMNISAKWTVEYEVSASTPYGASYGGGWYDNGSIAHVYLSEPYIYTNSTARTAFVSWSGVYSNSSLNITVTKPLALNAEYSGQYLVKINAFNGTGQQINISRFNSSMGIINASPFINSGSILYLSSAYYKGAHIPFNYSSVIDAPKAINVTLPVYDIIVNTRSLLDLPVNASIRLSFYNGTNTTIYAGSNGRVVLGNVPLGYAYGYAKYLGFMSPIYASNGIAVTLYFLSDSSAAVIAIVLIAIAAALLRSRHKGRKRPRRRTS